MKPLRSLAALFSALLVAALGAASPALAQSYTAASNTSFASQTAASPSATPGAVGNGWVDVPGMNWKVNTTSIAPTLVGGSPWDTGILVRQSSENSASGVTQKIEVDFNAYQNNSTLYATCHYQANGSSPTEYIVGWNEPNSNTTGAFQIYAVSAGSLGSQINSAGSGAYNTGSTGATYTLRAECTQTNSTTTTIKATLLLGSTVEATVTVTDTTAALQNVSSGMGMFEYVNSSGQLQPVVAARTYTAQTITYTTLPVNSPACEFSPGNWKGDTGRGGAVYRQSWNNGAWMTCNWTAGASPAANLLLGSTSSSQVSYYLNGVLTDNVAGSGTISLSPVANSANTLTMYLRNSTQSARWGQSENGGNTITVLGLQIDTASTAGTAPAARPWALIVGDSITEGIQSNGGNDDFLTGYSYMLMQGLNALGYDVGISACGYSGYIVTGDSSGDVPAYYAVSGGSYSEANSRWDKIDSGVSLLDANGKISSYGAVITPPALIFINYGTNETLGSKSTSDLQASVTGTIKALRAAAPAAKIVVMVPFGLGGGYQPPVGWGSSAASYRSAILAGVSAAADANTTVSDIGSSLASILYSGASGNPFINLATTTNVHPILAGDALVSGPVNASVAKALTPAGGAITCSGSRACAIASGAVISP